MLNTHEEVLFGKDGNKGMIDWIMERVEEYYEGEDIIVFSNDIASGDELRKGNFPSVQIYPDGDEFERKADGSMLHEITIGIAVSTKGPQEEAFKESSHMAEELYTYFKNVVPRIGPIRDPPIEGEISYSWDGFQMSKKGNSRISNSNVSLTYEFRC